MIAGQELGPDERVQKVDETKRQDDRCAVGKETKAEGCSMR